MKLWVKLESVPLALVLSADTSALAVCNPSTEGARSGTDETGEEPTAPAREASIDYAPSFRVCAGEANKLNAGDVSPEGVASVCEPSAS